MDRLTPIFVGGTGRSGTTVFKKLFKCHPKVATIWRELRLTIDPGGALDLIDCLSERWSPTMADTALTRFDRLVQEMGGDGRRRELMWRLERSRLWPKNCSPSRYSSWKLAQAFGPEFYKKRLAQLTSDLSHASSKGYWLGTEAFRCNSEIRETKPFRREEVSKLVADCFDDLYRQLPTKGEEYSHWLDDSPYNLVYAKELLDTFPNSRFVHIYRDPRDVLASYQTKVWGGNDFEIIAQRLGGLYQQWLGIKETLPVGSFREVSLENLAANPKEVLSELCEFVGMELDPSMLEFPLNKANVGRWKKDIGEKEMSGLLPYLEPALQNYGYSYAK